MAELSFASCELCPRRCRVNREAGARGYCGESAELFAARAALHFWEEPCISGSRGSGAVFFSGCTLRCVFCQNREIAAGRSGKPIRRERLAEIFLELQEQGAHNINLVTPTHYSAAIVEALDSARAQGLRIPIVYNTSGYERVEVLRQLEPYVDVYLPDFKYFHAETAAAYSQAPDYFETAKAALEEMVRQKAPAVFSDDGILTRGVLVRHLVLPYHTGESIRILEYLHHAYGDQILISILNQYTPLAAAELPWELRRPLTRGEYQRVLKAAAELGIENGFMQTGETVSESFIPPFTGEGL